MPSPTPPPTPDSPRTPPPDPGASLPPGQLKLFDRPSWAEAEFVRSALRTETVGGSLLLLAAIAALLWANSPWRDAYAGLRDFAVGPQWGHLNLTLGHWAGDGLLAIFFFVAALELKRELLVGDLRDPAKAVLPVVAAVAGVVLPAVAFLITAHLLGAAGSAMHGWAIPTATDIAFALAVLAVLGSHLPSGLRSFLLTLAVVDDLIAITIIAIAYTDDLAITPLLLALVPLGAFAALTQRRITYAALLVPLALLTWGLVHASGVHATVAGVLLGLVVPVKPRASVPAMSTHDRRTDIAHRFEHTVRPLSAGLAVPVFAFFAAGVTVVGGGLGDALVEPVTIGVIAGLVLGKVVGVFGATYLLARFTKAQLDEDLAWIDVLGLSLLTGIGFTVSLLIGELSYRADPTLSEDVKIAVLAGSLLAAALAGLVLRARNRHYRRVEAEELSDDH